MVGRKKVLGREKEQLLEEWIRDAKNRFNRVPSSKAIRSIALSLTSCPRFKASKAWVYHFLKKRNLIEPRNVWASLERWNEEMREVSTMETEECKVNVRSEQVHEGELGEEDRSENSLSYLFYNQF
jgi:hypothetical protein